MMAQKIKHKDKKLIQINRRIKSYIKSGGIENIIKSDSINKS